MRVLVVVVVMVSAAVAITQAAEEEVKPKLSEESVSPASAILKDREKFFFGSFSTTTYTQVIASTSTVFFSCLSGTGSKSVCQGRGARRNKRVQTPDIIVKEEDPSLIEVESSKEEDVVIDPSNPNESDKQSKFAFTIWTTARSTTSITVYYTNTSTTIRLSYFCYAGGIQFPEFNCMGAGGR